MDLGLILKAHTAECTSIAAVENVMVSAGKDDMLTVFSYNQGEYEFLRQISCDQNSFASTLDLDAGRILIGHANGLVQCMNLEGNDRQIIMASHADGEVWGLAIIPNSDRYVTCGDDNRIFEFSIKEKKMVRMGKIFTQEMNDGQPYDLGKKNAKSTAATQSKY